MEYFCEKCGHLNKPGLKLYEVDHWNDDLRLQTTMRLLSKDFQKVESEEHQTLFLSVIVRTKLTDQIHRWDRSDPPEIKEAWKTQMVPALETIMSNFEIMGNLAKPTKMQLAMTDLTPSWAVFCFVTVKKVDRMSYKLRDLGLASLLNEGAVDTLSTPARDFFNNPKK